MIETLTASSAATRRPAARADAAILLFAILLMLPEFVAGPTSSDSSGYTLVWSDQFAAAFRSGTLWPRWLPTSWNGLGSPTFYFYPPLFFWLHALIERASGGLIAGTTAVTTASTLLLAASGLAMRRWLRNLASGRAAVAGALLFMVAPYHIAEIYLRGAVAEAGGYAMLPLVLIAMRRLVAGAGGIATLALAYAALILVHLPSAVLASATVLPAYAVFAAARSDDAARTLARTAAGGLLGAALAAAYLAPALGLARHISTDVGLGGFYAATANTLLEAAHWQTGPARAVSIALVAAATMLAAVAAAWTARDHPGAREALFWAGLTIAVVALVIGLVPGFWALPGLAQVQFPWRLLLVAEFAAITALAVAPPRLTNPAAATALLALLLALSLESRIIVVQVAQAWRSSTAEAALRVERRDAPEYLPRGLAIPVVDGGPARPGAIPIPHPPPVSASNDAKVLAVRDEDDGGLTVIVDARVPARVVAARFWFPHWRVTRDGVPIAVVPTPRDRLASWVAMPGMHRYQLYSGPTPPERVGWAITIVAALLILVITALERRTRRR